MTQVNQWDIVWIKIRPGDTDRHPAVVISGQEWCASEYTTKLNVLACSKQVPAEGPKPHQVLLNGGDGLSFRSTVDCRFFHVVEKVSVNDVAGRVSVERRRAIGRKILEVLRLTL